MGDEPSQILDAYFDALALRSPEKLFRARMGIHFPKEVKAFKESLNKDGVFPDEHTLLYCSASTLLLILSAHKTAINEELAVEPLEEQEVVTAEVVLRELMSKLPGMNDLYGKFIEHSEVEDSSEAIGLFFKQYIGYLADELVNTNKKKE